MAENDTPGGGAEASNPQAQGFPLTVVTQYVKDLSFENPGGPDTLMSLKELPHGTVRVDVRVAFYRAVLAPLEANTHGGEDGPHRRRR